MAGSINLGFLVDVSQPFDSTIAPLTVTEYEPALGYGTLIVMPFVPTSDRRMYLMLPAGVPV